MNLKKIKLVLTIDLLNQKNNHNNLLDTIRKVMKTLKEEVGNFLSQTLTNTRPFGDLVKQTYSLQYENGTLDLDVVVNRTTLNQYIYSFDFR